jgi:hypothetical protein
MVLKSGISLVSWKVPSKVDATVGKKVERLVILNVVWLAESMAKQLVNLAVDLKAE